MFLDWKRKLSKLQTKLPNLPPFEKNLDFWRQLWKIVELSDVVVQVRVTDLKYSPIGTRERAPTACMTWQMSADLFPKFSNILEESVFGLTLKFSSFHYSPFSAGTLWAVKTLWLDWDVFLMP